MRAIRAIINEAVEVVTQAAMKNMLNREAGSVRVDVQVTLQSAFPGGVPTCVGARGNEVNQKDLDERVDAIPTIEELKAFFVRSEWALASAISLPKSFIEWWEQSNGVYIFEKIDDGLTLRTRQLLPVIEDDSNPIACALAWLVCSTMPSALQRAVRASDGSFLRIQASPFGDLLYEFGSDQGVLAFGAEIKSDCIVIRAKKSDWVPKVVVADLETSVSVVDSELQAGSCLQVTPSEGIDDKEAIGVASRELCQILCAQTMSAMKPDSGRYRGVSASTEWQDQAMWFVSALILKAAIFREMILEMKPGQGFEDPDPLLISAGGWVKALVPELMDMDGEAHQALAKILSVGRVLVKGKSEKPAVAMKDLN